MTIEQARRILVVANETVASPTLHDALLHYKDDDTPTVLVLAPALNSRLRHWLSDDDDARRQAAKRLAVCLETLRTEGIVAEGLVGDADPIQAIDDTLRLFPATEIVLATHPEQRSNWLARDVVARSCTQFGLPVLHIIVDDPAVVAHAA